MPLKIVRNDITKMQTEAIVNTANRNVYVGKGCDRAVYNAAGREELLDYRRRKIGIVKEGEAFITPGFKLDAKYIIHAVSPQFTGEDGKDEKLLRSCYKNSLKLAKKYNIRSIAFPLISTGSFGYPKEEGMRIAVDEINAFLLKNSGMVIYIVVFDEESTALGERLYPGIEKYISKNYVDEAKAREYNRSARICRDNACMDRVAAPKESSEIREERYELFDDEFIDTVYDNAEEKTDEKPERKLNKLDGDLKFSLRALDYEDEDGRLFCEASEFEDEDEYGDFEEEHESKLQERISHLSDTFSEYLLYLIKEKKMENAEVYKRAIVDKKIFSKIKNNPKYHPTKLTALCLCIGAKLNLDQTKDLLARAGYALSPCDKTDVIFQYFIENKIYDMIELDIQLEEHGQHCIIA